MALGLSICKLFRRRLKEVFYSPQKDILKVFFYLELKERYCPCPRLSPHPQHDEPGPPRPLGAADQQSACLSVG